MTPDEILSAAKDTAEGTFDARIAASLTNLIRATQMHITATMRDAGGDEWQEAMAQSVGSLEIATDKLAEALDILASRTDAVGKRWKDAKDALDARK
jgi:hypothetical protein